MAKTKLRRLTVKQELFIAHLLQGDDQKVAYEKAGYKCGHKHSAASNSYQMLRRPNVAAALEKAKLERARRMNLDPDAVVARFLAIFDRAMQEPHPDLHAAFKANEALGRHLPGFFSETVEHKGKIDHTMSTQIDVRLLGILEKVPLVARQQLLSALNPKPLTNGHRQAIPG